jgi:mannose-6-phosphate isomerase-like protein (cupin superfamily)
MDEDDGRPRAIAQEPEGGDPPCWAHLFDETVGGAPEPIDLDERPLPVPSPPGVAGVVDLVAQARAAATAGAVWAWQSEDLDLNLLVFRTGDGVGRHVNGEVDVVLVGIAGEGMIEIDGTEHTVGAGQALVIPKGLCRATQSLSDPFVYLSCHRRRSGLRPRM